MRSRVAPSVALVHFGTNDMELGDTSTLADPAVVAGLIENRAVLAAAAE